MPILLPCRCTASAFNFLVSNFIVALLFGSRFIVFSGVEWTLARRGSFLPRERPRGRHERTRYQQKVVTEDADQVEKSIEAGHDLAGFNAGDVHLRQAAAFAQFGLTPTPLYSFRFELATHLSRKA